MTTALVPSLHRDTYAFANAASTDPASPYATTSATSVASPKGWQPGAAPPAVQVTAALGYATNNQSPTRSASPGLPGVSLAQASFARAFAKGGAADSEPSSPSSPLGKSSVRLSMALTCASTVFPVASSLTIQLSPVTGIRKIWLPDSAWPSGFQAATENWSTPVVVEQTVMLRQFCPPSELQLQWSNLASVPISF